MNANFEYITNLQYKVKSLSASVQAFESGEKYTSMKAEYRAHLSAKDREIRELKSELEDAHRQTVIQRHNWWQVFEDMEEEHAKTLEKKERETNQWKARAFKAEGQRDDLKASLQEKIQELYAVKTELEEEKGRNQKLTAQINRDHENSSIPSSQKPNRKKITNNREKTGKKPGGQPEHKGHPRNKHTPTKRIDILAPEKYANSPDYRLTGKFITKQLVDIQVRLVVNEYRTPEFRHVRTGQRVHAEFPEGLVNEVTYGGSVKAFAFLLNDRCNVSIAKTSEFLSELTAGELNISTGMINGLSKEFSQKTETEQKKAFADILLSPVMNADFTTVKVNGQNKQVLVCATPSITLYFVKDHKGHKGVKDTPIEEYQHIMVCDHDATLRQYGLTFQECLEHVLRYLKDSMLNEPNLTWNKQMHELIREMIHFRKHLDPEDNRDPDKIDPDKVKAFETKYDEILETAKREYEYEPPGKYYKEGFNLYLRLFAYKVNHLLFLHDRRVPWTNNLAERLLRILKRKAKQMMTFRSDEGLVGLCNSLGVIATLRAQGGSIYEGTASIFDMPAAAGRKAAG